MAKRAASANELFTAAEAAMIGLYDGGVLSPAVLQRVITGFADSAIDWNTTPLLRTVDGKSLHEVVAMTMMPGRTIRNASKEFFAVIGHIGGIGDGERDEPDEAPEDEADGDLINQLSAGRSSKRPAKTARKTAPPAGFNPLLHTTAPRRGGKS
ncbi:hypothetical protein M0D69_27035 [Caballeronia sp. SEWSISQ10-4 2]|uniref:hypothetical protein n=1 Tax=Caballeronia sp. SEWSISQ10-4 2 TaxID=2937438 RepID=UPI0026538668|nr:hypothetical protein [Caballeronia sp. SEWSISQ10-4 2]MDN7181593.1 hypothetical protein [Caballeronia sp. SEWSISQ10-4 2]